MNTDEDDEHAGNITAGIHVSYTKRNKEFKNKPAYEKYGFCTPPPMFLRFIRNWVIANLSSKRYS